MDELASALRPHQVHLREDHAVLQDTLVRAALGEAHSDVVGIKHVLTALPVLDAHLAESAIQLLGSHPELLGQLGGVMHETESSTSSA